MRLGLVNQTINVDSCNIADNEETLTANTYAREVFQIVIEPQEMINFAPPRT